MADPTPIYIKTNGMTKDQIMGALKQQLDKLPSGGDLPDHIFVVTNDVTGKIPPPTAVP